MSKHIKGLEIFIILGVLAFIVVGFWSFFAGTYNGLATKREVYETALSDIETQEQRRFDLVPQLVGATRGTLNQEQEVFGAIAEARTQYAGSKSGTPDRFEAAADYQSALARLMVIIENYPQLRSNDTIRDLMVQIEGTENRISVARQRYNEVVRDYNTTLVRFPTNIVGGIFGFEQALLFEGQEGSENAPVVDLESGLQGNDDVKTSGDSAN